MQKEGSGWGGVGSYGGRGAGRNMGEKLPGMGPCTSSFFSLAGRPATLSRLLARFFSRAFIVKTSQQYAVLQVGSKGLVGPD